MGPNGAVVIRQRIVARLPVRDGANSPAVKEIRAQHLVGYACGDFRRSDAGIEALPGVGGADPARDFVAIEGQGIYGKIVAPECLVKTDSQILRLVVQAARHFM